MMENLSPEIWTTSALLHRDGDSQSYQPCKEETEAPPRAEEILRNIALMLAAHIAAVTIIVLTLHWLSIH